MERDLQIQSDSMPRETPDACDKAMAMIHQKIDALIRLRRENQEMDVDHLLQRWMHAHPRGRARGRIEHRIDREIYALKMRAIIAHVCNL